ncbi:hypothetical protein [Desulfurobacterium sp.]|uniref:hypothetical protein n=1 Tax=Desulfurobacterium sp. TaxID=2004706 RepID=UPI002616BCC5|nr:hypothetical protein [Desulfurobacterium sp.]
MKNFSPHALAIISTLIIATAKEIYDLNHPNHTPDFMDIFMTLLGCLTILIAK